MRNFVVGFMFDLSMKNVLLILKTHPEWQAGKYNGPGGGTEKGELTRETMVREFEEETAIKTTLEDWALRVVLFVRRPNGVVDMEISFYAAVGNINNAKTVTDEIPQAYPVDDLPDNIIPNLRWIIPMCLDAQLDFPIAITIRPPT